MANNNENSPLQRISRLRQTVYNPLLKLIEVLQHAQPVLAHRLTPIVEELGRYITDSEKAAQLVQQAKQNPIPPQQRACPLSRQEMTIAKHIVLGNSNAMIGAALAIKETTVKVHVKNILKKLKLMNRTQIALYMLSAGYAELPRDTINHEDNAGENTREG